MKSGWRSVAAVARGLVAAMLVTGALAGSASAQATGPERGTYVAPFPAGDAYRLHVFGDPLADGLAAELAPAFDDDDAVEVLNKTDRVLGLARNDGRTWDQVIAESAAAEQIDIAVVLFGAADRQPIRIDKRRYDLDRDEWRAEYSRRVDLVLKELKKEGAAVYWVGLPIMRSPNAVRAAELMNTIFRERAISNGVKFISTWEQFSDSAGGFSDLGPDMTGKIRQLRTDDGVYFTPRGYEKLAHFVLQEISRDIALAKADRDVPLAGSPDEQKRIRRQSTATATASDGGKADAKGGLVEEVEGYPDASSKVTIAGLGDGEMVIERPAIPGAVVAHLQRGGTVRVFDIGQTITSDLRGGLSALSSIALAGNAVASAQSQQPLTQSLFYKLLVKGEPLPSKPGRADDFSWPRGASRPSG